MKWLLKSWLSPCCPARRAGPRWELLAYGEVKELCKAAKAYRRSSPFFNSLIRATFTAHVITPHYLKHIMTVLLSPTEYTLQKGGMKRLLNQFLTSYAVDQTWAILTLE